MTTDNELRQAMARAMAGFAEAVARVEPERWDWSSPCDGWSFYDVVDHVVMGDRFAVRILAGTSMADARVGLNGLDRASFDRDGADPVADVSEAAAATRAAFDESLERVVDHPSGHITARRFLSFRVMDQLGHTWDLAGACAKPVELDQVAVHVALEITQSERALLASSIHFATASHPTPAPATPDGATERFLRAIGRSVDTNTSAE